MPGAEEAVVHGNGDVAGARGSADGLGVVRQIVLSAEPTNVTRGSADGLGGGAANCRER